jgi:hypothetical protein
MPMSSCNVTFENVYLYHACRLINPLVSSNSSYHRYLSYVEIKEKSFQLRDEIGYSFLFDINLKNAMIKMI